MERTFPSFHEEQAAETEQYQSVKYTGLAEQGFVKTVLCISTDTGSGLPR